MLLTHLLVELIMEIEFFLNNWNAVFFFTVLVERLYCL